MPATRCPSCSYDVLPNATVCPQCDRPLTPQAVPQEAPRAAPAASQSLRKLVWVVALLGIVLAGMNGIVSLGMAESAPQQAAGAAISCFYLIGAYTFARAVDALLR